MGPKWDIKCAKWVKFGLADPYTVGFQESGFPPLVIAETLYTQRYVYHIYPKGMYTIIYDGHIFALYKVVLLDHNWWCSGRVGHGFNSWSGHTKTVKNGSWHLLSAH